MSIANSIAMWNLNCHRVQYPINWGFSGVPHDWSCYHVPFHPYESTVFNEISDSNHWCPWVILRCASQKLSTWWIIITTSNKAILVNHPQIYLGWILLTMIPGVIRRDFFPDWCSNPIVNNFPNGGFIGYAGVAMGWSFEFLQFFWWGWLMPTQISLQTIRNTIKLGILPSGKLT